MVFWYFPSDWQTLQEFVQRLCFFMPQPNKIDFFISYTGADLAWAEWIAWQLEEQNYSVILQTWDFRPGSDFVEEMDRAAKRAERILLVLSNHAFNSGFVKSEWHTAFAEDPSGKKGILVPIRVERCKLPGVLAPRVYIDLVEKSADAAKDALLTGVNPERAKPKTPPPFPGPRSVVNHPSFPGSPPRLWNVPYHRNPFFTGRERILTSLYDKHARSNTIASSQPSAITGLGGIGKTQVAIEYVYRYRHHYKAVLWVTSETESKLIVDFVKIAQLLDLPEKNTEDQNKIIIAVRQWLHENRDWFMVFDNVEDFDLVNTYVPPENKGQILFTTRLHATGEFAESIPINNMEETEGILFLLRRSKVISANVSVDDVPFEYREQAKAIYQLLDGLPLALDQAAAFIEEVPCSLKDYIDLYKSQGKALRGRRGNLTREHPEPVSKTFKIAFKRLASANAKAADILRICAFLAPDTIPHEIFSTIIKNPLRLLEAIEEACRYSLLSRDVDHKTYSIHRLIQDVLRDTMDQGTQRRWAERCTRVVINLFPEVEFENWSQCDFLLPHAKAVRKLIEEFDFNSSEAGAFLNAVGYYLNKRAQYKDAELLFKRSLAIREKVLGSEHPDVASTLNNLAGLYRAQGKYKDAEPLCQRSLVIREKALGSDHPKVATALNNLAELYYSQGKYEHAEPLFRRSLVIREMALGSDHPKVATALNNLAEIYYVQGKYDEAEPLYQRSLAVRENVLDTEHPDVAESLNNLALLYNSQGKYDEAEPLYRRSLAIREKVLGPDHPDVGSSLNNLAGLYRAQCKYKEAKSLYRRSLANREKVLGPNHPDVALVLNNLAALCSDQEKYDEAEPLYQRSLAIREEVLGSDHPNVANSLNNLAVLYRAQGKYDEAEPLFQRSLAMYEKVFGPEHLNVAKSLNNLAELYRVQGKYDKAKPLFQRSLVIREKALGSEHPGVVTATKIYENFLRNTTSTAEVGNLERRQQDIRDKKR